MGKTSKAEQSSDALSAIGQAFSRNLKASSEEASMYNDLINVKAMEDFRAAWATTRSFEFVTRERETIKEKMEKQTNIGEFLPKSRIQQECGGESQEAKDMADMYVSRCESKELKDEFTKKHTMTGTTWYLWVKEFRTTSCLKTMRDTVRLHSSECMKGTWTEQVEIARAMRAYAKEQNVRLDTVTPKDVNKTDSGVKGYAHMWLDVYAQEARDDVEAKKRKAKAKAKAKGKAAAANNQSQVMEKQAKDMCSKLSSTQSKMARYVQNVKVDPARWKWAESFLKAYDSQNLLLMNIEKDNAFVGKLKAAIHIPLELKALKKDPE